MTSIKLRLLCSISEVWCLTAFQDFIGQLGQECAADEPNCARCLDSKKGTACSKAGFSTSEQQEIKGLQQKYQQIECSRGGLSDCPRLCIPQKALRLRFQKAARQLCLQHRYLCLYACTDTQHGGHLMVSGCKRSETSNCQLRHFLGKTLRNKYQLRHLLGKNLGLGCAVLHCAVPCSARSEMLIACLDAVNHSVVTCSHCRAVECSIA